MSSFHPKIWREHIQETLTTLAVAGLAAAWLFQLGWLAILAAIITGEELLESSLVVFGLTRGTKLRLHG